MGDLSEGRRLRDAETQVSRLEHIAHIGLSGLENVKSGIDAALQHGITDEEARRILQHLAGDARRSIGLMHTEYEDLLEKPPDNRRTDMASIYIAARFSKRPEAHALAKRLMALGHTISSRWVKPHSDHVLPTGLSKQAADAERQRFATEDIEDVDNCDWCVSIMEPDARNSSRGGRHVEFGYALGKGKRMIVIGTRETVFHHLPNVEWYQSADEFMAACLGPGRPVKPHRSGRGFGFPSEPDRPFIDAAKLHSPKETS